VVAWRIDVIPETRYARAGDVHVAYQVAGDGDPVVTFVDQWFSNVDAQWRLPPLARFIDRLSAFGRVVLLDKRGTGLSDPVPFGGLPTLEEWMDDIRAVLDDAGIERTSLVSGVGSSYLTILFAATYPERTSSLVLVDGYARLPGAVDYIDDDLGPIPEAQLEMIREHWGKGALLPLLAPDEANDQALLRSYAEYERQSCSPGIAASMIRMLYESDVRSVLPALGVPTLIVAHASSRRVPVSRSRYLAEHIAGAKYVELPGSQTLIWAGDQDALLREIESFVTGDRPRRSQDRVLSTVMFVDIVGSTERAAWLGDERWRTALASFHQHVRDAVDRHRGRLIKTMGDGVLVTFDGPARGIRCAIAVRESANAIGLQIRAGLHTGEIDLVGNEGDVGGMAVHIAARVCSFAEPGSVLVSGTVKDLVVGSGLGFDDVGSHALKGVPGEWHLWVVADA
jgi:class 3 adenylate cyclase